MRFVQGPLCAVLSVSLVFASTPGWSEAAGINAADRRSPSGPLQGHERIAHALNRFTFGARPGDVEAVSAMGLDAWFEQQLHPATIPDPQLEARLAQFPALSWPTNVLLYRLPSNAMIRQVMNGKLAMPERGALHTVYANQVARVEARRNGKAETNQPTAANAMEMQQAKAGNADAGMEMSPEREGVDPLLVAGVLSLPARERVLRLQAMPQPQLDAFFHALKGPQRSALFADMTPEYRETVGALENPERVVVEELMSERLTRDIYAKAQLQEVMTDFWLNHFNVYLRKNENMPYYLASYARDTIRPHALGKFEDLLEAVAHSPAMLIYLDNAESLGPDSKAAERAKHAPARNPNRKRKAPEGINENYARELMELHTLGVNGGYTQADVIQAARVLTGWTVDQPQRGGGFQFNENRHEPGAKKVLGKKFKDRGEREGEQLLHMLATRPATAKFLSREIADRFVSDDPPQTLVDRMAKTYLKSGGDIAAVLRTLYRSPEFWSQDAYRTKVKTPLEFVVSAVRASDADVTNMQPLIGSLRNMGMPLYGCIPPTGYKWDAEEWVATGALVDRMNFALALAANRLPGVKTNWPADGASPSDATPQGEEARLETELVDGGVSASTRAAVLEEFEKQRPRQDAGAMPVAMHGTRPVPVEKQDRLLAGLLLGSPEFQRR